MHYVIRISRFPILVMVMATSSCATIVSHKTYKLEVKSTTSNSKIIYQDSIYKSGDFIKVRRSKHDLLITETTDSLKKEYIIKPSISPTFLYGNLGFIQLCPVGYLIDLTNSKKYYYGSKLLLNINDTSSIIRTPLYSGYRKYFTKRFATNKKQLDLLFSVPYINSFHLYPANEHPKTNTGFWGLSLGVEYHYKTNKSIRLQASAAGDFFVPVPAAIDISGEYELMSSSFISLTDNYKLRRFTVGYGLNFSRNTWDLRYYDRFDSPPPSREPVKKSSNALGLTFTGYHQFGRSFFLGLIYKPTLLQVQPTTKFQYEHLISLDFLFKIRLRRGE